MKHRQDAAVCRDLVARWRALAERRLEHLTEMFESGRWRRYHGEFAFLENIQEAKNAVEEWRRLSTPEPARENPAIDAPRREMPSASIMVRREFDVPVAAEKDFGLAAPAVAFVAPKPALDEVLVPALTAIERRYPLLRNPL